MDTPDCERAHRRTLEEEREKLEDRPKLRNSGFYGLDRTTREGFSGVVQTVLDDEASEARHRPDPQLAHDPLTVCLHRPRGDLELFSDFAVRQPLCHEEQDLSLTVGQ